MYVLPSLEPMNINDTLASLTSPTTFYEAAVLSFRNTLTGHPPHALGDVVALCLLSYATSSYLSNKGSLSTNDASPCIDQWRDSISDRDHRQAFTHIMEALYPGTANLTPTPGPSQHVAEYNEPFGFTYQDAPFGMSSHQDNLIEDDFLNYLANYGGDPVPGYFALRAESTNQMVQRHCAESYRTRPTGAERPSLRDLQGSAVITQLEYFLEGCGELPQILSGRGATTKYVNCPVDQLTPRVDEGVKSCIQRMRQTELSLDATFSAIISVVDRLIQLGHLRTTEDVQEYMLIVGKISCQRYVPLRSRTCGAFCDLRDASTTLSAELQSPVRWGAIIDFHIEIKRYWESLINITRTQDLPSLEILFTSFPTPAHLYEAAIFTFRNILTGLEPKSLENGFALCSISYVASICSQRTGKPAVDNIFRDINTWRDSISGRQQRQLFSDLVGRLWEDMTASSFQTEQFFHSASPFASQDYMAPQGATMHDILSFSDLSDPFWGDVFEVPGSLQRPNFQVTGTAERTSHCI
ncbi:hypothetical protein FBULB1_14101 [Fusarium bulbicola]|nr:hypothetical protein FBULB1_14101 [Fusarium bulbicola]